MSLKLIISEFVFMNLQTKNYATFVYFFITIVENFRNINNIKINVFFENNATVNLPVS